MSAIVLPFNVGPMEMVAILGVVLLVFGAKRLPEIGSSMGKGIREFKKSIREMKDSIDETDDGAVPPSRHLDAPHSVSEPSRREGEPKKLSE